MQPHKVHVPAPCSFWQHMIVCVCLCMRVFVQCCAHCAQQEWEACAEASLICSSRCTLWEQSDRCQLIFLTFTHVHRACSARRTARWAAPASSSPTISSTTPPYKRWPPKPTRRLHRWAACACACTTGALAMLLEQAASQAAGKPCVPHSSGPVAAQHLALI